MLRLPIANLACDLPLLLLDPASGITLAVKMKAAAGVTVISKVHGEAAEDAGAAPRVYDSMTNQAPA